MKERLSVLFVEDGRLDVIDGAFVVVDKNGVRIHIPVGSVIFEQLLRMAKAINFRPVINFQEDPSSCSFTT